MKHLRSVIFKVGCAMPQSFPGRNLLMNTNNINPKACIVKNRVVFDRPASVLIGNGCLINDDCRFHVGQGNATILLGNDVFVGMGTYFICVSHRIGDSAKRAAENTYDSIKVGNGAWIGANVTILPGVTIGEGSVIAAGSVVTQDVKPNHLYAGVPAKPVKDLS